MKKINFEMDIQGNDFFKEKYEKIQKENVEVNDLILSIISKILILNFNFDQSDDVKVSSCTINLYCLGEINNQNLCKMSFKLILVGKPSFILKFENFVKNDQNGKNLELIKLFLGVISLGYHLYVEDQISVTYFKAGVEEMQIEEVKTKKPETLKKSNRLSNKKNKGIK